MSDIMVTTVYMTFTLLTVEVIRRVARFLLHGIPVMNMCVQECIAAFELCAVCYEIQILLNYDYGVLMYSTYLFAASLWWTLVWEEATSAPYTYIVNWIYNDTSTVATALIIPYQIFGGLMFYQYYTKPLWSLGYGQVHMDSISNEICYTDIQASVAVSAIVEGAGVCVCLLIGKTASAVFKSQIISAGIDAFFSTALVIAAMNISGGYYNSVLATSFQWGCFGSTPTEHFIVYWVGETIGALLARILWDSYLENIIRGPKPKSK